MSAGVGPEAGRGGGRAGATLSNPRQQHEETAHSQEQTFLPKTLLSPGELETQLDPTRSVLQFFIRVVLESTATTIATGNLTPLGLQGGGDVSKQKHTSGKSPRDISYTDRPFADRSSTDHLHIDHLDFELP